MTDAEIGRLTIAEARALIEVQRLTDEPGYQSFASRTRLLDAATATWLHARAACRAAVLERLESS